MGDEIVNDEIDGMSESTQQFLDEQPVQDYAPKVPWWLRDATYYAGIGVSAAMLVFPEYPLLVRIGAGITLVGNSFAKAYRREK